MTHQRPFLTLCLGLSLALSACDTTDPGAAQANLTFSVSSATAQQADVTLDGRNLGSVALPWTTTREGATFALAASSDGSALDVTVRRGTATVKRASGQTVVLSGDATDDEVEIEGSIDALDLDAGTLTVAGLAFIVTAETEYEDAGGLADFAPGDHVEIEGFASEDGTLIASEVEREDEDEDGEVEVEGTIESLGDGLIAVAGLTFDVTDDTEFDGFESLLDLVVGDRVEIEAYVDADGLFVATEVEVEDDEDDEDDDDN